MQKPPENLVKAICDTIDHLGKMTFDELYKQDEIGFMELLDMTYTLRIAIHHLQNPAKE